MKTYGNKTIPATLQAAVAHPDWTAFKSSSKKVRGDCIGRQDGEICDTYVRNGNVYVKYCRAQYCADVMRSPLEG